MRGVGFSMKLDAPERDMHGDLVLSVALAAWWGEQSPETRQCWLVVWAIHALWLLASLGAHDAESARAIYRQLSPLFGSRLGEKRSTMDLCRTQYRRPHYNVDCMILRRRGWRITFQRIARGISLPPTSCVPGCPGSSSKSCGGM